MKLNNKGFALTSIIYMLIVLFLMIMLLILANLASRKVVLDRLKNDVKEKLNQKVSINTENLPYQNTTTGIFYETLNAALNKAESGNIIKVLKDVKEITTATNTQGTISKSVVLDLNGKTVDYIGSEDTVISNTGTLEIKDTGTNGKISTSTITGNGRVIYNRGDGNLILTSGKIEVLETASANGIVADGKTLTINGGEITNAHSENSGIYIVAANLKITNGNINAEGYGIYNTNGKIEINGGTIQSNVHAAITSNSSSTIYITGGNISSTGSNVIQSSGNVVMTNGTIDAYSGCGIICTGSGNATISGGTITKRINPITNQWVGGAAFQITNGTGLITGNAVVQNEEGNSSNVIYNGGTGTLTIDENATVENKSAAYAGTNASTGKIVVKSGLLKSNGRTLYNVSSGSIDIQGGTVSTSGSYPAIIANNGTVTIGTNEGGTPSQIIPSIIGGTYGVSATTSAIFNFYDGKITGASGKSISKTPDNIPSGTQVIKTTSGSNEIATLKPVFITNGAATVLDASNHGSGTTWTALTGTNGTVNNATWGTNYLEFNGTNSFVNLGRMDYTEQTLETTISIDTTPAGTGYFIGNIDGGGVGLAVMTNNKIAVLFATKKADGTSYNYNNSNSNTTLELGKKYHICMTYDGSKIRLYINGKLDFEKTPVNTTPVNTTGNTIMALGGNPSGNTVTTERFKGKIYSAAVYNRALSEQEIKQNAMAGMYVAGESISPN